MLKTTPRALVSAGKSVGGAVALNVALAWGLLTVASVVTGYVANRS